MVQQLLIKFQIVNIVEKRQEEKIVLSLLVCASLKAYLFAIYILILIFSTQQQKQGLAIANRN